MLALPAIHVVAPTALLDARFTLGAFLGVVSDPVGRFAVVRNFFQPLFQQIAIQRIVPRHLALEAAPVAFRTLNFVFGKNL